jgi:thioester reductase-like protein
MAERHLITGATGFFGSALALRLLSETDADLVLLVRDTDVSHRQRALHALHTAGRAYGYPAGFVDGQVHRLSTVAGDLSTGPLPEPGRVDRVWHSAASLRYQNRYRAEIHAVNVGGTRRALDIARASRASLFHYISTAYVAGSRSGAIEEAPVPESTPTNNLYEHSKVDAESVVLSADGLATQILRPSIIVGHSQTGATLSDFGLYGFLARLNRFAAQAGVSPGRPLTLRADPSTPLNLVPIDLVVQQAVHLGHDAPDARIVHLTNDREPTTREVLDIIFDSVGVPRPRFTDDGSTLSTTDQKFDRSIEFYRSYISGHKTFQQSTAERAGTPLSFGLTHERLRWLCSEYLRTRTSGPVKEVAQ